MHAIYAVALAIQTMFYPEIMFLEITFKNYVLGLLRPSNEFRKESIYFTVCPCYNILKGTKTMSLRRRQKGVIHRVFSEIHGTNRQQFPPEKVKIIGKYP